MCFKGEAGDAVIYPSNLFHEVKTVTRGQRIVAITWIQSIVRDPQQRRILFDLASLARDIEGKTPGLQVVTKCYFNLLPMWAEI